MFIAIIGLRFSGKSTVKNYLIAKGFTSVHLGDKDVEITASVENPALPLLPVQTNNIGDEHGRHLALRSGPTSPSSSQNSNVKILSFGSPALLLDHVTQNWRSNFVTTDLDSDILVNYFIRRPFFMLISVDAPILQRYHRCHGLINIATLEDFVREHDREVFGDRSGPDSPGGFSLLRRASPQVKLKIVNSFDSIAELHYHLDSLDIKNTNRLRPQWDTYFMTLADLASQRSNCMKRRVGAILVRENRIVSTGYNGTPRGVKNCNEGGCGHCNRTSATNGTECLCLHAEENALLEAGRDRVGANATMYCNTCPCLKCTIKIIQCGVKRVVYNLSYKVYVRQPIMQHFSQIVTEMTLLHDCFRRLA
ncbi:dCMP deaminase [Suillus placidus]|uniref:Deoxycytidylate deaminase n=1 Tax=Suillus placidus TaxID=48579 RepID=A0A9P7A8S2_9AGAM|nr:dCMP deaminase [Suillus placidus]